MSLIIFDLDGTLAKTNEDLADAVNSVRMARGYQPLSVEMVTSLLGCGAFNLIKQAIPELGGDDDTVSQVVKEHLAAYDKCFTNKTRLYPGVMDTLEKLSQRHTLAVFTNKAMYQAQGLLEHLGVAKLLKCIVGDNGSIPLKPAAEAVYYVAREAGSPLDGAWIVGDNWTDIQAGRNAGIRSCFCQYGFGKQRKAAADASISSFDFLDKVIK